MQAIAIDDYDAPAALHDLPMPEPAEGEIVVRVRASSINGFDYTVANGHLKHRMEHHFPVVLGRDFAGTVEATGDGVEQFRPGDKVFGVVMGAALGPGSFAEYVNTPSAFAAVMPDGLGEATAGAVGLAGATAFDCVEAVDPAKGETVLVVGATGGVGAFAVQLAAARGARVIGTAGSGDEAAFVRGLGAHETVDHHGDLAAAVRALHPDGVDAVVHLAGDGAMVAAHCKPGGRLASTIGLTAEQAGRDDVVVRPIMAMPTTETLGRLADAVLAGELAVPIHQSYVLTEVPRALADFATRKLGKLAVRVPE